MPKFPGFFRAAILLGQFLALATHPHLQAYFQVAPMGACNTCPYNEIVVPLLLMPRVQPKASSLTMGSFILKDVQPQPRQGSPKRLLRAYVTCVTLCHTSNIAQIPGGGRKVPGQVCRASSCPGQVSHLALLPGFLHSACVTRGWAILCGAFHSSENAHHYVTSELSEFQICHLPEAWFWWTFLSLMAFTAPFVQ